jgi:polysaccharide deacetylase 2 family uncharacterized protein YibQ
MAKQSPPARRSKKGGDRYTRTVIAGIIVSLVVIGLVLWGPLERFRKSIGKPIPGTKKEESAIKKPDERARKEARERETGVKGKTVLVAIVIDDLGQDLKPAKELLSLSGNITFAVMPGLPQSRKVAELALKNGREVFLHLPMEPKNGNGKRQAAGMLRSDMTPMEFKRVIAEDIASVPGAVGVNNHEGSSLTENREAMTFLMDELRNRDLRFLDSLTSPRSVAQATAKEFGVKTAKRDVFLDNESDNPSSIRSQLAELSAIAKKHGKAVGIGHPHPATIAELKKWFAEAEDEGIEIVPASKLMN